MNHFDRIPVIPDARAVALRLLALLFGIVVLCVAQVQSAAAYSDIMRFAGRYSGSAEVEHPEGHMETRNMFVEIRTSGKGFWLKWTTQREHPSGKVKTKSYDVLFEPSGRGDTFSAAMRQNVFGHAVPLDPLKGEPYVWGRLVDDTLTVFSLFIGENGDYEIQQYDRTLVEGGLQLHFSSHRNGFARVEADSFLKRD